MTNNTTHTLDILQSNPGVRFTSRELAQQLIRNYPEELQDKDKALQASGRISLEGQLTREVPANLGRKLGHVPGLKCDRTVRPQVYYWEGPTLSAATEARVNYLAKTLNVPISAAPATPGPAAAPAGDIVVTPTLLEKVRALSTEHALYEPLRRYLQSELGIMSLRIDEKTSTNSRGAGGNHWLHPDVAGLRPMDSGWDHEVRECARLTDGKLLETYSFEVKRELSVSNVRESIFQAVSNCSWANHGYLVATNLPIGDTLEELRMLCAAHGIGFLLLVPDAPEKSRIVIPSRGRESTDWMATNRIARQNRGFDTFVRSMLIFLRSGHLDHAAWGLSATK